VKPGVNTIRRSTVVGSTLIAAAACAGEPGTVQWQFQTPGEATLQHLTVGPDGTIYTSDREQTYALSPGGALLWTNEQAWGGRPISLGADGTIYTAIGSAQSSGKTVIALNPDGTTKWTFTPEPEGGLREGPGVGPNGNIFAVQEALDFGGLGAFALDPDGNLLWSNQGDPLIHSDPGDNGPVVFNDDRLHFGVVTQRHVRPSALGDQPGRLNTLGQAAQR
jgi:outer membrane protein assembly factor BamB